MACPSINRVNGCIPLRRNDAPDPLRCVARSGRVTEKRAGAVIQTRGLPGYGSRYLMIQLFDRSEEHGYRKILGGCIVGTHAGDVIGEIAVAVEIDADMVDIGKKIHCTPRESISMAAEIAHCSCTDMPHQQPKQAPQNATKLIAVCAYSVGSTRIFYANSSLREAFSVELLSFTVARLL